MLSLERGRPSPSLILVNENWFPSSWRCREIKIVFKY